MKIVFFGSPPCALPSAERIIEAGHDIKLVVTQPDRPSGRGKRIKYSAVKNFALAHNIPIIQPLSIRKDLTAVERIKEVHPELIVVVAYGQIIPGSIIYIPRYNSLNVHFSLLPKYRGASPVQWALLKGETVTGVTIFELNEKMDEGDILSQRAVDILPLESAGELESRLSQVGADLLLETMADIDKTKPVRQDHSQATYAPRLKKEDGRIDWAKDALDIERQVRAFQPWPSAYAFLGKTRMKILKGKKKEEEARPVFSLGEILALKKEGIEVCCGQKSVFLVEEVQPENRRPMSAYTFSLGAEIEPGDKFL